MAFGIKDGYRENPGPVYFLDDPKKTVEDNPVTFQPDVYAMAELLCELAGLTSIVDVGCGWAEKLEGIHQRHPDWSLIGIDYGANIAHCQDTYDWGEWLTADLEEAELIGAHQAVLVCSDVIEHLVNPVPMLHAIRGSGAEAIVISTPERDIQYGYDHMGPSKNLCHVREWNAAELHHFLESEGLTIDWHGLTRGNDQTWAMGTQLVVCH